MKKEFKYCSSVIALGTLMFLSSCSGCTKTEEQGVMKVDSLPRNPKAGQVYHDSNDHSWVYDAMMMRWIMDGGSSSHNNYYYYPSTGSYTDGAGKSVTPPASVSSGISNGVKARTQTVTKPVNLSKSSTSSTGSSTKSTSSVNTKSSNKSSSSFIKSSSSTSSKSTGKSVFGSTGRSHVSVSA